MMCTVDVLAAIWVAGVPALAGLPAMVNRAQATAASTRSVRHRLETLACVQPLELLSTLELYFPLDLLIAMLTYYHAFQ